MERRTEEKRSCASVAALVVTAVSAGAIGREAAAAAFQLPVAGRAAATATAITTATSQVSSVASVSESTAELGSTCMSAVVATGVVARLAGGRRGQRWSRSKRSSRIAVAAGVVDTELVGGEDMSGMKFPKTDDREIVAGMEVPKNKRMVERELMEGSKPVEDDKTPRPSGQSTDEDKMYWWKMSQDKRTIDVIFPIDDDIQAKDIIFRLGEECAEDSRRGPTLEVGHRYKDDRGVMREEITIDGQILNTIRTEDTLWTIEQMDGVKVVIITLTRPSMMRARHDPILQKQTEEERIEPQTWDALLVEERVVPKITDTVYFDISLDGEPAGRLEMGLYGEMVPKTAANFKALCSGKVTLGDGTETDSTFTYKGMSFDNVLPEHLLAAGNPGLDSFPQKICAADLKEYFEGFKDFSVTPREVGPIGAKWCLRWGGDLGNPLLKAEDVVKSDGAAVDGNSDEELKIITDKLAEYVEKGEGASLIFFRPEFEMGVGADGTTFPAENFNVPHAGRGNLSMNRTEDKDIQGSCFFMTLKEFPEMDKRWVTFGKITAGEDLLSTIEDGYDAAANKVVIEDCGVIHEIEAVEP